MNLESTSRFCAKFVSGPSWMGFTAQQILHSTRFSQRELLNWQINDFLSNLESTSRFCAKLVSGPSWMGFTIQQVLQNYQWRNHSVQSLDSRLVSMILVLSGHPWNSHVLSVGPKKTFKTNFFFKSIWLHLLGLLFSICQIIDYRFGKTNSDLPSNAFSEI